jgi:predicted transcriptional regulator
MQKANLNFIVLENYFAFLIKQGAVEGRFVGTNKLVYMITDRGLYLTKCFIELNHVIPASKNEYFNLKKEKLILNDCRLHF